MIEFCQTLFTMTAAATVAALAVMVLRLLLKRVPRSILCALWLVVLFRMVCPISFEAPVSIMPHQITSGQVTQQVLPTPAVTTTAPATSETIPVPTQPDIPAPVQTTQPDPYGVLFVVWAGGAGFMALWAIISYLKLRRRVADAILIQENIFETDRVDTSFVCGLVKPRIYLPVGLDPAHVPHVVRHEQAHIQRLDHLMKPLFWLGLCLHWFNPVLWLAYILFCRDLETACDQRVVRDLDRQGTADYAAALLCLGREKVLPQAVPLAFGEENAKGRVKGVLHYKKPAFWVVIVAVVLCVGAGFLLLSDSYQGDTLEEVPITEVSYGYNLQLAPAGESTFYGLPVTVPLPEDLRTRLVAMLEKYGHEEYTLPIILEVHEREMEDPPESVPIATDVSDLNLTSSQEETQFLFQMLDNGDGYLERFVFAAIDEFGGTRTQQQAAYIPGLAHKRDFRAWQADLQTYLQTETFEGHKITHGCLHEPIYNTTEPDGQTWGWNHVLDFPEDLRRELIPMLNKQDQEAYVPTQPGDLEVVRILDRLSDITFAPDKQGWNYALMLLEDGTYCLERYIPDKERSIYTQAARYPHLADSPDFQQWLEKLQEYLSVELPDQIYEMRVDSPQQARYAMTPFVINGIVGDYTLDHEGNRLTVQVETPTQLHTIEDQRTQYLGWVSQRMIDLIGGINTVTWVYPPTEELPEGCFWEISNYQKAQSAEEFRERYNSPKEMSP